VLELVGRGASDGGSVAVDFGDAALYRYYTLPNEISLPFLVERVDGKFVKRDAEPGNLKALNTGACRNVRTDRNFLMGDPTAH
jgi:hypothetical protein